MATIKNIQIGTTNYSIEDANARESILELQNKFGDSDKGAISLGTGSAEGASSVVIGSGTASGDNSIVIGSGATYGKNRIAIGVNAIAGAKGFYWHPNPYADDEKIHLLLSDRENDETPSDAKILYDTFLKN